MDEVSTRSSHHSLTQHVDDKPQESSDTEEAGNGDEQQQQTEQHTILTPFLYQGPASHFVKATMVRVEISAQVRVLDDWTFATCHSLTKVTLPSQLQRIGRGCFYECVSLERMELPASLRSIGPLALASSGITSMHIPRHVQEVGGRALACCKSLERVTLESTWTAPGILAHCSQLQEVHLPAHLTHIPERTFAQCNALQKIELPEHLISIGKEAFQHCTKLTNVTIPHSVSSIHDCAFQHCRALTQIQVPRIVHRRAFASCEQLALVEIRMIHSTTTEEQQQSMQIAADAFEQCPSLFQAKCTLLDATSCNQTCISHTERSMLEQRQSVLISQINHANHPLFDSFFGLDPVTGQRSPHYLPPILWPTFLAERSPKSTTKIHRAGCWTYQTKLFVYDHELDREQIQLMNHTTSASTRASIVYQMIRTHLNQLLDE